MQNKKLKVKFFQSFAVFHSVSKHTYKLKLFTKMQIPNVFYISLLKQNLIKEMRVNKLLDLQLELGVRENKEYKVEIINDSFVYIKAAKDQLSGLYYLVS